MAGTGEDRVQKLTAMHEKKEIVIINGSASAQSSNEKLIARFSDALREEFEVSIWLDLKSIPHFDPELAVGEAPAKVRGLREAIGRAVGVVICTPEYIFSIPSGLKNVLEWCVATTIFSDKPVGIITASADGRKGHEELQLIMRTLGARLSEETTLLIQGIKGKIDIRGEFKDEETAAVLRQFVKVFRDFVR